MTLKEQWKEERRELVTVLEAIGKALESMPRRQPSWEVEEYRQARPHLVEAMMWIERRDSKLKRFIGDGEEG